MNESDLHFVFSRYLYFFDAGQVETLKGHCQRKGWSSTARWIEELLAMDEKSLSVTIGRDGDEDDLLPLINVYLWKQKVGEIDRARRLAYSFDQQHNAWLPHRYMIANGYEGIEDIPIRFLGGEPTTYNREIEKLLRTYGASTVNDDEFSLLSACLNVIGPRLRNHSLHAEVRQFVDFIVERYDKDVRLENLPAAEFTILASDMDYPPEISWPAYQFFLSSSQNADHWWSFPGWLLGPGMYGDRALQAMSSLPIPLEEDLLRGLV